MMNRGQIMKQWKRTLVWVGVVLAVLFFVPFLIPMNAYIKQSAWAGEFGDRAWGGR
jgi:hypothetical protein